MLMVDAILGILHHQQGRLVPPKTARRHPRGGNTGTKVWDWISGRLDANQDPTTKRFVNLEKLIHFWAWVSTSVSEEHGLAGFQAVCFGAVGLLDWVALSCGKRGSEETESVGGALLFIGEQEKAASL